MGDLGDPLLEGITPERYDELVEHQAAGRRWRFELNATGDTPEDLLAAIATAVEYFRQECTDGDEMTTAELEVVSSPHPAGGWRWSLSEDQDAVDPAEAAMAAHKAAGGAVRRRGRNTG